MNFFSFTTPTLFSMIKIPAGLKSPLNVSGWLLQRRINSLGESLRTNVKRPFIFISKGRRDMGILAKI